MPQTSGVNAESPPTNSPPRPSRSAGDAMRENSSRLRSTSFRKPQPKPPNAMLATSVNAMLEGTMAIGAVAYSGFGSTIT